MSLMRLHRQLKSRAALAGMSLSDYLLAELRRMAGRPSLAEMRERLAEPSPHRPRPVAGGGDPRRARRPVIVVDASAVVEVLLRTPAAAAIRERLFGVEQTLHAPHLLDIEVTQVLRRYAVIGQIEPMRGSTALDDLMDFPLTRYPHDVPLERVGNCATI